MATVRTAELDGLALDWAVAVASGVIGPRWTDARSPEIVRYQREHDIGYNWSRDWSKAGPIMEDERIGVAFSGNRWLAFRLSDEADAGNWDFRMSFRGDTPLVAAMRCHVAAKLGVEVDVPDGLLAPGAVVSGRVTAGMRRR